MSATPRIVLSTAIVIAFCACGSRDALDSSLYGTNGGSGTVAVTGGSTSSGGATGTGGIFGSGGANVTGGTGGSVFGTGGLGSGGFAGANPIAIGRRCIACATTKCPATVQCLLDQACRNGTLCLATTCLSRGGTPDPQCIQKCFNGDTKAATNAILALACLATNCTQSCTP